MRILLVLAAIGFSATAFAQTAPPKVGNKPLVQMKPKGSPGCKFVGTVKGTKLWAGDCEAAELRSSVPATETRQPGQSRPVRNSDCAIEIVDIVALPCSSGLFVTSGRFAHRGYQSSGPVKGHGGTKDRCRCSQDPRAFGGIGSDPSKSDFLDSLDDMPAERRDRRIEAPYLFCFLQKQRLRVVSVVCHR